MFVCLLMTHPTRLLEWGWNIPVRALLHRDSKRLPSHFSSGGPYCICARAVHTVFWSVLLLFSLWGYWMGVPSSPSFYTFSLIPWRLGRGTISERVRIVLLPREEGTRLGVCNFNCAPVPPLCDMDHSIPIHTYALEPFSPSLWSRQGCRAREGVAPDPC